MSMNIKIVFCISAFSIIATGQTANNVAAKPADAPKIATPNSPAPKLETSKIWRLNSKALQLRKQADETPAAKEAVAAEKDVSDEQSRLAKVCTDAGFVLGYQTDAKADNYQDLICIAKPPDPPASGTVQKEK